MSYELRQELRRMEDMYLAERQQNDDLRKRLAEVEKDAARYRVVRSHAADVTPEEMDRGADAILATMQNTSMGTISDTRKSEDAQISVLEAALERIERAREFGLPMRKETMRAIARAALKSSAIQEASRG